jgi:NAD(P)-dependent dehydrogenase (short-subunit alcohol dehydrogenase family)
MRASRLPLMRTILVGLTFLCSTGNVRASTILITGADRGLGLEFTRQYSARGDRVIATCRHPESASELHTLGDTNKLVIIEKLDVESDDEIRTLASKYHDQPIDILINNAGVLGTREEQSLGTFSRKSFQTVMDINAYGPLAVSEAFHHDVSISKAKKIIAITSGLGSIAIAGDMPSGPYYYRMSKAAMNMAMRALGADLKSEGIAVALVSPGMAETRMLSEFQENYKMTMKAPPAAESVAKMIRVIDGLDVAKAGQGVSLPDGAIKPW